jgi:uncharacterized protein
VNEAGSIEAVEAIKAGDLERLRKVIDSDPSAASARDESGLSPVLHARYRDRTDLVEVLIEAGIQLDVFEASAVGAARRVEELLEADSSAVHAWSVDGYTPLHLAAFFGHPDTVHLLLRHGADPMAVSRNPMEVMPLHSAMAGSDVAARRPVAELLLDHGAEIDARTHGGYTPLMEAAQNGDVATARLLLARGADPTLESDQGTSAESLASAGRHEDVVELLRSRG